MEENTQAELLSAEAAPGARAVFSVDVEDWFHILDVPSTPSIEEWKNLPSRVESNFPRLLELFGEKKVHVTCFFLGWIAERFPHLVKECVKQGHEVASHGYAHRLIYEMTREEFRDDATRSRQLLEDISGAPVRGYRASGFSVTDKTPWFFEELSRAGYYYDSSVFPAKHGHGGMESATRTPYIVGAEGQKVLEFPMTVADFAGNAMCFFGGGYLRLFPYWLIRRKTRQVLDSGSPVVFYLHPREIDPEHPRLPMSYSRRFRSYVNLRQTEEKVMQLLDEFPVTTFQDFLSRHAKRREANSDSRPDFSALCGGWPQLN